MRRRHYTCNPSTDHVRPCRVLYFPNGEPVGDECGCGCDVVGTCTEWGTADWEMHPRHPKNERRRRVPTN